MAKNYSQHSSTYWLGQQTTTGWGTPETTALTRMNCEPSVITTDIQQRIANRQREGQTVVTTESIAQDFKGASPTFIARGPVRKDILDHYLFGVMQKVAEGTGTPFLKTFTTPTDGQVDFPSLTGASSAGWIGTFVKSSPEAGKSKRLTDVVIRRLKISGQDDGPGSILMYEAELVARGAVEYNVTNPSGTVVIPEDYYYFHDLKVFSAGGVNLIPTSFEIEMINNAVGTGNDTGADGNFYTYGLMHEFKMKCSVHWSSDSYALQDNIASLNNVDWIVSFGTSGVDGYLRFLMDGQSIGSDVEEDVKQIDFEVMGVKDVAGGGTPLTVSLENAIDRAWPA